MKLLAALGHPLHNTVMLDVVRVVGLDVGGQAVECPLKRIFRGGVHHTRLQSPCRQQSTQGPDILLQP